MKQTADDNQYIPVWKLLKRLKATAQSLCHSLEATAGYPYDLMGDARATLRAPNDYDKGLQSFLAKIDNLKTYAIHDKGSYDVTAMCLRVMGFRFFQICHCAEWNKIIEAKMPVNPYHHRKVSLQRPHGNGDWDIIQALYTCPKANVSETLKFAIKARVISSGNGSDFAI